MRIVRRIWLVLITAFLASLISTSFAADPPLPTPVGRVVWVKGNLKATMVNNEQRLLQKTSVIYLQDVLTTDATSQAQIVFTDGSLITFYPNTKFEIAKYAFDPSKKKGSVGSYFMNLIEGGFRTITGLIAKGNPKDYQVNTPVATIGVRGTDYAVYMKGTELFVGYYGGTPCVTGKSKKALCLNNDVKYAKVASATSDPVPLAQQPSVFAEKLEIVPAAISPFGAASSSGPARPQRSGGVISSFCISQ